MRSIFKNRSVILVVLVMIIFISTLTWVAVCKASAICHDAGTNSVLNTTPAKGKMIWDEIAHGLIFTFSL